MKAKAPISLLKKIIAALSNKTNELRVRIMIYFLLHKGLDNNNTKISSSSLTHKLHSLVAPHPKKNDDVYTSHDAQEDHQTSLLMYHNYPQPTEEPKEEVERISLTSALFEASEAALKEEEESGCVAAGMEEEEEKAAEEEEEDIDQAADMFIKRFKRQMLLQKQHSLERYHQRLLEASV